MFCSIPQALREHTLLHIDAQNFVDHMLRALIVITTIIYKLLVTGVSNNNNITKIIINYNYYCYNNSSRRSEWANNNRSVVSEWFGESLLMFGTSLPLFLRNKKEVETTKPSPNHTVTAFLMCWKTRPCMAENLNK